MKTNIRGRRGAGERTNSPQVVYEDFQPVSDWTSDSNSHVLLVDIIGFKKEQLKVEVDNNGKLVVRGEKQLSENKYKRFEQVHSLPIDSDTEKIESKFTDIVLSVIIPKKGKAPKEQQPVADGIAEEQKGGTSETKEKPEGGEPKQEATTNAEEKPKISGKDTDVKHENENGIHGERKRAEGKDGTNEGTIREKEEREIKFGSAKSAVEMTIWNKGMMVIATILGLVTVAIYLGIWISSTQLYVSQPITYCQVDCETKFWMKGASEWRGPGLYIGFLFAIAVAACGKQWLGLSRVQ